MEIIRIKTWGCICGYHQDFEPTILLCPSCKKNDLFVETDPDKQVITTTIDEAGIKEEIEKMKERKESGTTYKEDEDISTKKKEEEYKEKRLDEAEQAKEEMKQMENDSVKEP